MAFRPLGLLVLLLSSVGASAAGLGEINNQPALGERLRLEINILGGGKEALDASCYELKQPSGGDDIPWLKSATLSVRKGGQPVLEIRSIQTLHDPILAVAVQLGCGQEILREYLVLASPAWDAPAAEMVSLPEAPVNSVPVAAPRKRVTPARPASRSQPGSGFVPHRAASSRLSFAQGTMSDRLTLSAGSEVGDPALRLSPELSSRDMQSTEISEAQREMLRLEFRMLLALHEQALTELQASEKLRNLDKALGDLQKNTAEPAKAEVPITPVVTSASASLPVPAKAKPGVTSGSAFSMLDEWGVSILLLLATVGVAGWLGWRTVQERHARQLLQSEYLPIVPLVDDEESVPEEEEVPAGVDVPVAHEAVGDVMVIDFPLDADAHASTGINLPDMPLVAPHAEEPVRSATVDKHFEANPVMELADIMLSFGRVKGAAQALQEYIDANPQEALQPWIRLMDIYRLAGMRPEFEALTLNLNKNFNVEIQHWEKPAPPALAILPLDFVLDEALPNVTQQPKADCLEDMPHIMQQIIERWSSDDVTEYLQQLLRDNRGGSRLGFALNVIEEILFLIELKDNIAKAGKSS